ncbi:heterokaryon incompatibility protein-domain-containing protein [Amylocarpus encephaloides]|uniref:Heterokaryon incompatibility protein-domain-containing protein n=1 Tax=Amylocarpus encephaloides TaxID=45428 RepID=A0A9P7YC52_9HELO|nr:heterokaryon incompatibility protein-domain-containing protein [Amylocarpus encephaloides]
MRLLEYNTFSQLILTEELIGEKIPKYAILSHTWGASSEEVTFKDLIDGTGSNKSGYNKIRLCGEQARHDGLRYFWVDSCCIDKSSSAILSEAIISMFRWYHNAVKCYVYLADVSRPVSNANGESTRFWESTFGKSKWFTRGWTLQELLAPASVEFYSKDWEYLGDKRSLERHIHGATSIPTRALQGGLLSSFSIDERLGWSKGRNTTREEDKVYSLLGIVDVQMSSRYGEGETNAFRRLWRKIDPPSNGPENDLIHDLPYAVEAPFNSYNHQYEPTCHPDTRVDLLQDIYNWSDGRDERHIFLLNGLAGTGKSTIARTIARKYSEQGHLGASFFFSRGVQDASHASRFFTSLAVQLSKNVPRLQHYISDAVFKNKDIANQALSDQWRQLILRPLLKLHSESLQSYIIVVDALDECEGDKDVRTILQLLAEARSLNKVRLRVFLTSRPETPIRHGICAIPRSEHQDFVLHTIQPSIVNHDISLFLEYNLGKIGQEWTLGISWPGEQVLRQLVTYASGLFIWAATACRFIREGKRFARKRLDTILKGSSSSTITEPEKHLNGIYLTVLKHSISSVYSDEEKKMAYDILKHTVGSIVVLLSPLSALSVSMLLHLSKEVVDQTFEDLYAILDIPENPTRPLRLHHPSFRDFLLNKERCEEFWVDEKEAHQKLATCCIKLISHTLKKDIYEMRAPGSQVSQNKSTRVEKCLPPEVQYACLYWVQHLQKSGSKAYDDGEVHRFLQAHLLHWLEALGWLGKTSEGIQALLSLEAYDLVSYLFIVYRSLINLSLGQ